MSKISKNYSEKTPYIYNLSLDQALKSHVVQTTKRELPLVFENGKIKDI